MGAAMALGLLAAVAAAGTPATAATSSSSHTSSTVTAASTGSVRARDIPSATAYLGFCNYQTNSDLIAAWEWPGGQDRSGNTAYARATSPIGFNSIPWISSNTIDGQRWIYGAMLIPSPAGKGTLEDVFGWVGKDYLTTLECGNNDFVTSSSVIATTHTGDPFSSEPSEVSATFQGQTWVWGVDPYVTSRAGWVGSSFLTLDSCTSSGCSYTIKNDGVIHEYVLPGGYNGP
jgi:hypothetical protein